MKRKTKLERLAQSKADRLRNDAQLDYEWVLVDNSQDVKLRADALGIQTDELMGIADAIHCYNYSSAIIALRLRLLDDPTSYEAQCVVSHYRESDGAVKQTPVTFILPEMPFLEMRTGSAVKVNRGGGIKTRWRGLDAELQEIVAEENLTDEWQLIRTDFHIKFIAKFTDAHSLATFNRYIDMRNQSKQIFYNFLKAEYK